MMSASSSVPRVRRKFSEEFKADAVAMVTELGKSRAQVARELDVGESVVGRWVAKATGTQGSGRGSHMRHADPDSTDPDQMRLRISELEKENEFLKKAAAFFAREHL